MQYCAEKAFKLAENFCKYNTELHSHFSALFSTLCYTLLTTINSNPHICI